MTAIGAGVAVVGLVILAAFAQVMGFGNNLVQGRKGRREIRSVRVTETDMDDEEERAIAAAIAVGALLAEPGPARSSIRRGIDSA